MDRSPNLVRLYTIQPLSLWEEAQRRGVLTPDQSKVLHDWPEAYAWMREQMSQRLPHYSGDYPVWAWLERPDLRRYRDDRFAAEPHVLLTVDVPRDRVLTSDFEAWHFVLNGWFLAVTEDEFDLREQQPPSEAEVRQSWERIFDSKKLTSWVTSGDKQACIDRLLPGEVVAIRLIRQRPIRGK